MIEDIQEKRKTLPKTQYFKAKNEVIEQTRVITSECKYLEELIQEGFNQTQIRKVKNFRFSMNELLPLLRSYSNDLGIAGKLL